MSIRYTVGIFLKSVITCIFAAMEDCHKGPNSSLNIISHSRNHTNCLKRLIISETSPTDGYSYLNKRINFYNFRGYFCQAIASQLLALRMAPVLHWLPTSYDVIILCVDVS